MAEHSAEGQTDNGAARFIADPDPLIVHRIGTAIQQMSHHLDEEDYASFMAFFGGEATYKITAFSAELRKEVAFLDLDREGLDVLLKGMGDHVRFPNKLIRHPSPPMLLSADGSRVTCLSKLAVYHIDPRGAGGLYAVGQYMDCFDLSGADRPMLVSRNVALETRTFPFASHIPL